LEFVNGALFHRAVFFDEKSMLFRPLVV
jgi:hypothetical protein